MQLAEKPGAKVGGHTQVNTLRTILTPFSHWFGLFLSPVRATLLYSLLCAENLFIKHFILIFIMIPMHTQLTNSLNNSQG